MELNYKKPRSYSIGNEEDICHITNGRCPSYALSWGRLDNVKHWPEGHDYFMGNGEKIYDGSQHLREILSQKLSSGNLTEHIIFCDLDGVLADFEKGVENKFKKPIDQIPPPLMWSVINKSSTFFETLPWMPKGRELWDNIKQYHPIILTGVPPSSKTGVEQKIRWCQRELGPDVQVITCATKDKPKYCLSKSILIDDRLDNLKAWNDKGGKFILYDENNLDEVIERINRHMEICLQSP